MPMEKCAESSSRTERTEEVEGPPDEAPNGDWRVTLSYLEPADPVPESPIQKLFAGAEELRASPAPERVLRVIVIDPTGRPKAMKIRARG